MVIAGKSRGLGPISFTLNLTSLSRYSFSADCPNMKKNRMKRHREKTSFDIIMNILGLIPRPETIKD